MAGIYVHVPFCRKICGYCDFYRTTKVEMIEKYIDALLVETKIRKGYLEGEQIKTIYFGGGTPSVLEESVLRVVLTALGDNFNISADAEITIEANPDDITPIYLDELRKTGFNRISMGVQSWSDKTLKALNRRHNALQAQIAVEQAVAAGFADISIDLIYGLPGLVTEEWERDLDKSFALPITHISAYHLTIEEGTPFGKMKEQGIIKEVDEEESAAQFNVLIEKAAKEGFIQYEISNFGKEGYFSEHNSSYWKQVSYLGLGPSAHSFNGYSRQWNISDVSQYVNSLRKNTLLFESEDLDQRTRMNEYILTSLRTMWGIDLEYVERVFEKEGYDYIKNLSGKYIAYGLMRRENNSLILTNQGIMIADNIIAEFIMA